MISQMEKNEKIEGIEKDMNEVDKKEIENMQKEEEIMRIEKKKQRIEILWDE